MSSAAKHLGYELAGLLGRLAGPILDKELRVAARRRRYYVLRSAYVALLCIFVAFTWLIHVGVGSRGSAAFAASRMGEVGRAVTGTILWFQFIGAQLLACALLSGAIGDEVRARTLGVLLTTHINSFQIVLGKLLSRLLQMLLLVAISLPLLSILRVFGGVHWSGIWAALVVTTTSVLFIGSLSLLVSCYQPQGYRAVFVVLTICTVLFLALPMGLLLAAHLEVLSDRTAESLALLTNPFMAMAQVTEGLFVGGAAGVWVLAWFWHCLVMLGGAGVFIGLSMRAVRRAAVTRSDTAGRKLSRRVLGLMDRMAGRPGRSHADSAETALPIKGSPILWREMHTAFMRRPLGKLIVYSVMAVILLFVIVLVVIQRHVALVLCGVVSGVLSLLLVIRLAAQTGSCITREKEGRTWPILLTTPMDDRQIIRDKALAAVGRNLPMLVFLFCLQVICGVMMAAEEPMMLMTFFALPWSLAGSIVFVTGMGVFFSVTLRSSVASVAVTVAVYLAASYSCCGCMGPMLGFMVAGPMMAAGGSPIGAVVMGVLMQGLPAVVWAAVGLLLARLAVGRVRRNVF